LALWWLLCVGFAAFLISQRFPRFFQALANLARSTVYNVFTFSSSNKIGLGRSFAYQRASETQYRRHPRLRNHGQRLLTEPEPRRLSRLILGVLPGGVQRVVAGAKKKSGKSLAADPVEAPAVAAVAAVAVEADNVFVVC